MAPWHGARDLETVCQVEGCNALIEERHHSMPVSLVGRQEAERWPILSLCNNHHLEWHSYCDPDSREGSEHWYPPALTCYGRAALVGECADVKQARAGNRHPTLLRAATRLGQLIPHEIPETRARMALWAATAENGMQSELRDDEIVKTINDGFRYGMARKRYKRKIS